MAERRMFAKSIVLSDSFLDMPISARCLYFTLGMLADDDGFVGGPRSIMRQCGATDDDMRILLAKRYVLDYPSGVIVIKHWRMNNYLQNDRHHKTTYIEELAQLTVDAKGAYVEKDGTLQDECIQDVYIGKDSIGKDSIGKDSIEEDAEENSAPAHAKRKKKYGEFKNVSLTEEELDKLKTEHGSQETEEAIRILDEYMETSGKKYKSCYLALKKWGFRAVAEQGKKQKTKYDEVDEWLAQQLNNSQ